MTVTRQPYGPFDRMPVGGSWRPGSAGRELTDTDPWSGEVLARIPLASPADAEDAYAAAEAAQPGWAAAMPEQRAGPAMGGSPGAGPVRQWRRRSRPVVPGQPHPGCRAC
jgi:Aldehyde dehydrogenase family